MKNMFVTALETAFDEFFTKRNPNVNLNDPHILGEYREELDAFAKFLVEEYEQSVVDADFFGNRFLRNED